MLVDKRCNNCGGIVPGDSDYCPLCGEKIVYDQSSSRMYHEASTNKHDRYSEGGNEKTDSFADTVKVDGPRNSSLKRRIPLILLSLLCAVLLIGNIYQFCLSKNNAYVIQKDWNDPVSNRLNNLYNTKSLGYASKNFKSSDPIVFVQSFKTYSATLTAYWNDYGEVNTKILDEKICAISFDSLNWYKEVKITITGKEKGVTKVTFANNVDNKEFSIIVVVY